jgi:hypothetical protein
MKCCDFSKWTWTVVPEPELTTKALESLRVIILPELLVFGSETWEKLEQFVRSGGTVIATGESGLHAADGSLMQDFAFANATGIHFRERRDEFKENHWGGYAAFSSESGKSIYTTRTTPPLSPSSIRFTATSDPVATFVEPAVILGPESWVNWAYPPPATDTGEPLIVRTGIGTGAFWYAGFDLFGLAAGEGVWVKELFSAILGTAACHPVIKLETANPGTISFTAFMRGNDMIIHLVSMIPGMSGGDCPPVPAGQIVLGQWRKVLAREVYPSDQRLESSESGEGVKVDAGTVMIHKILMIRKLED